MSLDNELELTIEACAVLDGENEELRNENSELKAQVEQLREALEPFATGVFLQNINNEEYSFMHERIKDWLGASNFKKACVAYDLTQAQCLAEHDSEVAYNALMDAVDGCSFSEDGLINDQDLAEFAQEYNYAKRLTGGE